MISEERWKHVAVQHSASRQQTEVRRAQLYLCLPACLSVCHILPVFPLPEYCPAIPFIPQVATKLQRGSEAAAKPR